MASVSPLTLHAGQAELASGNSSSDQSQDSADADAAADKAEKPAVSPTLHLRGCVKKKWSPASGDIVGSKKLATPLSAFSIELDSGSVDGSVVYRSRQVKKKYQHWRQNGAVSGKA